jgi:hypothetical protein
LTAIERKELIDAVLASRSEVFPGFDTELLEAIVDAEAAAAGDADIAMRAVRAAVTAAMARGVGRVEAAEANVTAAAHEVGEAKERAG